jgi:hypothetical protein
MSADGFAVSALNSSDSDSDSDSDSGPALYGLSTRPITFGDLRGRPPAPQEEEKPVLPTLQKSATDQTLREIIIDIFGFTGNNTLSLLSSSNILLRGPAMYATYNQSSLGRTHPVTLDNFMSNLQDYLNHKGGRKKQKCSVRRSVRHSIIKKRKSMSKKRKNGRKSNKKQRIR